MKNKPRKTNEIKALSRMADLCARREYCVFDIKTKLMRYNLNAATIERIIEQLINEIQKEALEGQSK